MTALALLVAAASLATAPTAAPRVDRFDGDRAFAFLRAQVALGPRPAGSPASRRLAERLRADLPRGAFQTVPNGLRNVYGVVRGRQPGRVVVVGAHYDTEELPGFVGANDGASGVAVVRELARTIRPRMLRPTVVFVLFDGEEDPPGSTDFLRNGLRGSRVAARAWPNAEATIVVDMVGDRNLSIPRESSSDAALWRRLRAAAGRVGTLRHFPARTRPTILDDHTPFLERGVPAIDVIDFGFLCWHRRCDNLRSVSPRSVDAVGETVFELLRAL